MKNRPESAPIPLSPEAKRLKAKIVREYQIEDPAGLLVLQIAFEAFDRMREAQAAIAADGPVVKDRWNQTKAHPMLTVERDARAQFLSAIRQLGLDLEPLHERPGRPSGRGTS